MTADTHSLSASFVCQLAALHFNNVFNPYTDVCPNHDKTDAALIRRRNLELVLDAAISGGIDSMWVARDLGYRGGRRTGLALTDDVHLHCHAKLFATPPLSRATRGPAIAERTATVVWQTLQQIDRPIFLWNVFPLHPHEPGDSMSNRCHTRLERTGCQHLHLWLIETLRPKQVISIGLDAHKALAEIGVESVNIRHPSYGGRTDFLSGLSEHYGIPLITEHYQDQLLVDLTIS